MAKSAFVAQIAFDLADQGKRVLFLSLEQGIEELIERIFCNRMSVDNFDLLRGRFKTDNKIKLKWETFGDVAGKIPLIITDGIGKTFKEVNTIIELFEPKPDVIILDFIQHIARKANESREMMNEYIRHFREICLRNNIAGVLCSQINRLAMKDSNREPSLATLKETGTLEEAADLVLLLHWDYFYTSDLTTRNKFKITVAKNRNGRTGVCEVFYIPEYYKFTEDEELVKTMFSYNRGLYVPPAESMPY